MPSDAIVRVNLFAEIHAGMQARAAAVVIETADDVADRIRGKLASGDKSGRVYTSGPPPLPHQASAPGQAPANWTEALSQSVHVTSIPEAHAAEALVHIGEDLDYAAALEFGSEARHLAPRPFVNPSAEEAMPGFRRKMEAILGGH